MLWTAQFEKTLESPLDCKEIQPVHPKGNHSWIFIGRTDVEAETPILWPPDKKNWLTGKDPDAGKDSRQKEKRMTGGDGWMASPTRWTWVWASSRHWCWTGKPGVLQSKELQELGHSWATELNSILSWIPCSLDAMSFSSVANTWILLNLCEQCSKVNLLDIWFLKISL